ncbi:TOMM precursor leader peptide-binding protein [Massilia sp. DWR3-1-1]|uniref:TOMM precursor leader peptide-binding protein n=1 Tax=Massilia sp. DWR3-1-1 TaxID=2804559 RepID=UPI003CF8E73B
MSDMIFGAQRLRLQPFYVLPGDGGEVILHANQATLRTSTRTAGDIVGLLAPLLNGEHDASEVQRRLHQQLPVKRARALLHTLHDHGFLTLTAPAAAGSAVDTGPFEAVKLFFSDKQDDGGAALAVLQQAHVLIVNAAPMTSSLVANLLQVGVGRITVVGCDTISARDVHHSAQLLPADAGRSWQAVWQERVGGADTVRCVAAVPQSDQDWTALLQGVSMAVAVIDGPTFFYDSLHGLNRAAQLARLPWTLLGAVQHCGVTVGPTIVPPSTACFSCFETRLKSNLHNVAVSERLEEYVRQGGPRVDFGHFAPRADIAANLACIEVCDTLLPSRIAKTTGKMLSVELDDYSLTLHHVLKLPRCPVCGRAGQQRVAAWA